MVLSRPKLPGTMRLGCTGKFSKIQALGFSGWVKAACKAAVTTGSDPIEASMRCKSICSGGVVKCSVRLFLVGGVSGVFSSCVSKSMRSCSAGDTAGDTAGVSRGPQGLTQINQGSPGVFRGPQRPDSK